MIIRPFLKRKIKILSVDGGGIRGYIPALILSELERRLGENGNKKPLARLFDLMAGTSTGSIVTTFLSAPKQMANTAFSDSEAAFTAEDIADMYEDHGLDIFPRRIFHQFQEMRHAFTEKYNDGNLSELLTSYLERRTVHGALTNLLIPAFDIERNEPVFIKKVPSLRPDKYIPDYYMSDAVRAASAAPTYFEPVRVSSVDGSETRALIDGGIFANNPAMCAFVEAQKVFPRAKKYVILSIGTGVFSRSWSYEQVKDWGVLEWLLPSKGVPATAMMSTGLSRTVDYQLTHLPGVEYHRINIDLEDCSNGMDDASEVNMRCLRLRAEEAIRRFDTTLHRIASVLD